MTHPDDTLTTPAEPPAQGFFKRHKALSAIAGLLVLLLVVTAGWAFYLNRQVSNIDRFDAGLNRDNRPARVPGEAMNILLVGADDGHGADLRHMLRSGDWKPGSMRSDTTMVWHLSADRRTSQLVSLPRDSWVPIPGHGTQKLNAAFAAGGPQLLSRTLEDDYGVYIDHVAVLDFEGFKGVTEALGGVTVSVDGVNRKLEGEEALAYVRDRHDLPGGDFDRIRRQQNFLRAVMGQLKANGTLLNPLRLTRLAHELGGLVAVDDGMTTGVIRSLAIDIARARGGQITFLTVPHDGTGMVGDASVVFADLPQARAFFDAIEHDDYATYAKEHPVDLLPAPDSVH